MDNGKSEFYSRMVIAWIVTSVSFMELLDTSILNTAVPVIATSFETNIFSVKTAVTAYLAALAIFIPVSGWIADAFGTKRTMISAIFLFAASSLMCGLAHSLPELVFFRILQGIGGALMTPVSRLILIRLFTGTDLAKAAGLVAVPIVFGPVIGPVLGGYIVTHYHWSWIFFINVPIGALAMALIGWKLENEKAEQLPPFDVPGFLFAGCGLALLCLALENLDNPGMPKGLAALMLAAGAGLCGLLIRHCLRKGEEAVFDLSLFRLPTFRAGLIMIVLGLLATGGLQFLLPVMFQTVFLMTPFKSGLLTFFIAIGSVLAKPFIVETCNRLGYDQVLGAFPAAMGLMVLSLALVNSGQPFVLIAAQLLLYGVAFSFFGNLMNVVPYLQVERARTSRATSLQATVFQLAMSLGVSCSAVLLDLFLRVSGKMLGPDATGAFHWCFIVTAALCGVLCVYNLQFRKIDFGSLRPAAKSPQVRAGQF